MIARLVSLVASPMTGSIERKLGEADGNEGKPFTPEAPPKFIKLAELVLGKPEGRPAGNS